MQKCVNIVVLHDFELFQNGDIFEKVKSTMKILKYFSVKYIDQKWTLDVKGSQDEV